MLQYHSANGPQKLVYFLTKKVRRCVEQGSNSSASVSLSRVQQSNFSITSVPSAEVLQKLDSDSNH